jgi:hypothetical protein
MERMRCSLTGSTRCEMEREKAVEFIKGRGVGIHLHRLGVSRFKKKDKKRKKEKGDRFMFCVCTYCTYGYKFLSNPVSAAFNKNKFRLF